MITIKHLIIFKEVARVKSMSKAAENLYISQPSISKKIQEIENYYNIKLFQRYSKTLGISQEGQIFLKHTENILKEIEQIDSIFLYNKEEICIRIGLTLTVSTGNVHILFEEIKQNFPNLHLQVYVDNTQSIENLILDNNLDIAIIEGDINNENICLEPIFKEELVLVCSKKHLLSKKNTIDTKELSHMKFVTREKGSGSRTKLEKFMSSNKIPYYITWESHSWDSVKKAVIHNQGLALIPKKLIEKELKEKKLHKINVKDQVWQNTISFCYHKNKQWNKNLEIFKNKTFEFFNN